MKLMEQEFAEIRDRLFPLMMDPVQIQEKGQGQMVSGQIAEGLFAIYGIEEPGDKIRYVTYQDLRDWGVSHTTVHLTAVKNLEERTRGRRVTKLDTPEGGRPMFIWALQDGYDAARILLPEWLHDFAEAVEGNLVLGVPHRNWLVAIGDADAQLLNVVQRRVALEHRGAGFPVSPYLYTFDGERIHRYVRKPRG
ncbi:DUF1444 family protein [Symbiobacterium terraclitae]|uniref:DUF1444 family protein n=1 Tax=Symbiobacterium terraclitae TaxID=557451 RepID=UPI0035B52271